MDHHLYCLDAESGELIWEQSVGAAMAAPPILEDGVLYVGAFDGKVHALKADTGERIEGFNFQAENWIWSEVLLVDGELYVTALDGKLYGLDPSNGAVLAPYPYDSGEASGAKDVIRAAPVQAGDSIVVATESGQVVLVRDAIAKWTPWSSGTPPSQGSIYTTPVVQEGTVYVVLMNGQVWTVDAETGQGRMLFSPPASQ
jgi:outer membrane protein assembly factor BamB